MHDCIEFGIIPQIDASKEYYPYLENEPLTAVYDKYSCISVPDEIVNQWIGQCRNIPTYFASLDNPSRGIDHYGVTLVSPDNAELVLSIVQAYSLQSNSLDLIQLISLLENAISSKRYIICFGL